ncbi:MAG: mucoidy inhibitor MuiA family protein [Candidatus Thorarchaeota archaeon]
MTELSSEITHVTVFRDGARITRSGRKKLSAGPQKVVLTGITSFAQEDSFRIKGKGPASLSTIDVRLKDAVFEPDQDSKPLFDEIKELEKKKSQIIDEISTQSVRLENMENMLTQFVTVFGEVYAANEAEISQLTDIEKATTERTEKIRKKIRELREELEKTETLIQVARNNLSRLQSQRRTISTYDVEVSLEVAQESEIELEVMYQCSEARWSPSYDVDLLPGKSILRRVAMVNNQTQEDWKNVNLIISTATARPVEAIEGTPFWISVYEPPVKRELRKERKMSARVAMPAAAPPPVPGGGLGMMAMEKPVMEEDFADASETASGIAVYELPKPMTIPFDTERHPVTLTEEELESKTMHYWYPDGMAEVVAQDVVANGDNVILPGKVKVYSEGDYVGETTIHQVSPREEFKLGTRVAYDVKAKKILLQKEIEKAGITRGKRRRYYKYRLEIENFSKRAAEIEIVDRVPHSNSTAIEIKLAWEKLEIEKPELGVMKWKKKIDSGKKLEIVYDYEVLWEKDVSISPPLP